MTTLTRGQASKTEDGPSPDAEAEPSRFAQWWASWRVAVRMARRDVRRHRGRSALIVVMVGLPVLVLVVGNVLWATAKVDPKESIPFALGSAQAQVAIGGGGYAVPQFSADGGGRQPPAAKPIPGFSPGHEASSISALVGGTATRVTASSVRATVGRSGMTVKVLGLDVLQTRVAAGKATLISGRWATNAREVVVTRVGVLAGLPSSGEISIVVNNQPTEFSVVGVGDGYLSDYGGVTPADLISLPDATGRVPEGMNGNSLGAREAAYLIDRPNPFSEGEVRRLNDYGILVQQPGVTPDFFGTDSGTDVTLAGYTALAGVGLLLLTTLLAGPAFAVSATRQRRNLALSAANGATRQQLRRAVLGQALVLGVGAAVVATGLGLCVSWAGVAWGASHLPGTLYAPLDLPGLSLTVVLLTAVASTLAAALLPARGLGRLDIVRVLRGQDVSPRLHRGLPVLGFALLPTGTLLMIWGVAHTRGPNQSTGPWALGIGVVAIAVAALCLVPAALLLVGFITSRAPVTLRMATRDAARQRGRATPTVAAIMAALAVLTAVLVIVASDLAFREKTYRPLIAMGSGSISLPDEGQGQSAGRAGLSTAGAGDIRKVVASVDPALRTTATIRVDLSTVNQQANDVTPAAPNRRIDALRTGCTAVDVVNGNDIEALKNPAMSAKCTSLSGRASGYFGGLIGGSPDDLAERLHLTATQRTVLEHGGVVVIDGAAKPQTVTETDGGYSLSGDGEAQVDIAGGAVMFVAYSVTYAPTTGAATISDLTTVRLPAVAIPRSTFAAAFPNRDIGAILANSTLDRLGWPTTLNSITVQDPRGPISPSAQAAIEHALDIARPGAHLYVERGYVADQSTRLMTLIAMAVVGFLVIVATLIATALSQAEGQAMMGTLAAVGATRLTRRNLAGAQAASLALIGSLLGIGVGLIPGIVTTWNETQRPYSATEAPIDPTIVIPWLQLATPLVLVPLIAAGLAWVSIRRAPMVTRRLT